MQPHNHQHIEYLDHPADVKFRVLGKTIEEAFEYAALAMFGAMIETFFRNCCTCSKSRRLCFAGFVWSKLSGVVTGIISGRTQLARQLTLISTGSMSV
jgi:hypothetical protein